MRPLRGLRNAALPMALLARNRLAPPFLDGKLIGARLAHGGLSGVGRKIGRKVRDVLVAQRRRLRPHGRMLTRAAPIALQRYLDVVGVLPAELRHVIGRVRVAVSGHAVTTRAGLGEQGTARRITLERERQERWRRRNGL